MEPVPAEGAVNIWWTALGNGDRFWKGATAGFDRRLPIPPPWKEAMHMTYTFMWSVIRNNADLFYRAFINTAELARSQHSYSPAVQHYLCPA